MVENTLFCDFNQLDDIINNYINNTNPKKIYLLCGKTSFISTKSNTLNVFHQPRIEKIEIQQSNPDTSNLIKLLSTHQITSDDMIIAIGGGSIIDYGKLMMYFNDEADVLSFIKGNLKPEIKNIPFLAIPTTFGSGSEATSFAVLYHQNTKYSVSSPLLLPKTSIIS